MSASLLGESSARAGRRPELAGGRRSAPRTRAPGTRWGTSRFPQTPSTGPQRSAPRTRAPGTRWGNLPVPPDPLHLSAALRAADKALRASLKRGSWRADTPERGRQRRRVPVRPAVRPGRGGRAPGSDPPGAAPALRSPDRRRAPAPPRGGARARPPQGRGRRGGEAQADRVEPAPRHVDHAHVHEGGRAAARPDPGGEPRPDPGGGEVRLPARLQALYLR